MSAHVPLDVDLEDRLLYGLTPLRLAYVVVALLAGFALWSSQWAPSAVRASACILVIGVGALVAWGRWRGRAADAWLLDGASFAVRCYRIGWNDEWFARMRLRRAKTSPSPEEENDDEEAEDEDDTNTDAEAIAVAA
jgi:hypothetical protein